MMSKSLGPLVPDRSVYPRLKKSATGLGFKIVNISKDIRDNVSDTQIAEMYGKGNRLFLTYDKTAYLQNPPVGGFAGFIEYDDVPKEKMDEFISNFENVVSSVKKKKDFVGYRTKIHISGYDKEKLPTR